jgi:hypothetical protein
MKHDHFCQHKKDDYYNQLSGMERLSHKYNDLRLGLALSYEVSTPLE